ncbi:polysaccharide export outer membrane protein [Sphingobium wenxiniae]|jgi:polysaccharide export outer membrane protein|uniref:Uncharacterized protein n=2 Tax=Sphingobium TaxID=165695 RepID=T0GCW3_9SPHN|nr:MULTISPECIES: polysaccharide biosynthesis/export family protein [Sphingobium]EQA98526.1 hypothetical protein L485_17740 [Sphingobium baderi LL03]KMS61656.1 hypothetical protein V475_12705 [Sphingobium baderi LL03]MBB6193633.1 polysaccharide export outer membrane protein [Sphingobium wenxiniae]WRD75405.1 polysaccharide biosynthesis/export family protein [Sphingobium baderi]
MMTKDKRHHWLGLFACMAMAACSPTSGLTDLPPAPSSEYALGAGDELRISVYGLDGLANNYVITDAGVVSLPFIGDVAASNKTADQIKQSIAQALVAKQIVNNPIVNVQVNQYRPFFIIGEVKKPGEYPFRPGTSVLTAIAMAGGYTFRANTSKFSITRRNGNGNITAAATEKAYVQPGDTIRVYESWF